MTSGGERRRAPRQGAVHPRRVWLAVLCCLAGLVLLATGVMELSWWLALVGVTVFAAGIGIGFRAGWLYDVHAGRAAQAELHEVARGDSHQGVTPGQMVEDTHAQTTSKAMDRRRELILSRAGDARAPLAELGAGLLLLTGIVLLVAQWSLYPHTATGQANGRHAMYVGIVGALVGLRILTARGEPHLLAGGIGAVAGAVLLVLALTAPHSGGSVPVFEAVCGLGVVLGSAACLSWREHPPRRTPVSRAR